MSVVRVFPFTDRPRQVRFDRIAPAGFRILGAFDAVSKDWPFPITITSGTDGTHSGPTDPHPLGEAYDIRSNDLPSVDVKHALVRAIMERLSESATDIPFETSGGWATEHFFGFLEAAGTANEHIHIQRRKGTTYP
jgi:hypothetical protein